MSLRSKTTRSKTAHSRCAYPTHAFPRNWTALDLADAVPLRLSERIGLGLVEVAAAPGAASGPFITAAPQWRHRSYLRGAVLPAYIRVR